MYRILVLTDHRGHNEHNSLYALCRMMAADGLVETVHCATRGLDENSGFFEGDEPRRLVVTPVTEQFRFSEDGSSFDTQLKSDLDSYDVILIRLPPPAPPLFLTKLAKIFPSRRIINRPEGILKTGSKAFLLELQELCPPMRLIDKPEDIIEVAEEYPVVIKPLNEYGGKGVTRIIDGIAENASGTKPLRDYAAELEDEALPLLAVKYLAGVGEGDRRSVVVNGEIIGSTLRYPKDGGWLCNVAQGGSSALSFADKDEVRIAKRLSDVLKREGVIIFGFDTLVDDDGKRVLSEINTTSVGGLIHIERDNSDDVLRSVVDQLIDYIDLEIYG